MRPIEIHEIRVVIVGIDHEHGHHDYQERRDEILGYQRGQPNFNQHYRGVVKTAAAILGSATGCMECAKANRCLHLSRNIGQPCVLEMFSQPNLLRCANGQNATSKATPEMRRNCARLLVEELEILKPTLIVFHGAKLHKPFQKALSSRGWKDSQIRVPRVTKNGFLSQKCLMQLGL
jgi:hypothetical protein